MLFKLTEGLIVEEQSSNQEVELHIYADANGKFYLFDGEKLIEIPKSSLSKKIKEIEGIKLPDNNNEDSDGEISGSEGGPSDSFEDHDLEDFDDTEFEGSLADETFLNGVVDDIVDRQRQEKQKHDTELARKLNPNSEMVAAIKKNIKDFITNELQEIEDEQERYWTDKNSFDDDNARKLPHEVEIEEEDKPLICIYIDESGSCQGPLARNLLDQCASAFDEFLDKKHPENSKIIVEWWYFGSTVSDNPSQTGWGTSWTPLKNHIIERKPDNVIIMTDSDLEGQHGGKHIRIPGSLWCIFVNRKDRDMHIDFDAKNYREYLFTGC